jgi:hypothetical protein
VLTIDNVPPQYSKEVVSRLVLSATRGTASDITGIKSDPAPTKAGPPTQRVAVLTVNPDAVRALTVAGQRVDCQSSSRCNINRTLRVWFVDSTAANQANPRLVAGTTPERLQVENVDSVYDRLGLKDGVLPPITPHGTSRGYAIVHLLDDSHFQIFAGEKMLGIDALGEGFNLLKLTPQRSISRNYDPTLPSSAPVGVR